MGEMQSRCPKCRCSDELEVVYSLLFTLEEWPVAMLFTVVVGLFGDMLKLGGAVVLAAGLIAIVPLIVKPLRKTQCGHCGIEFEKEVATSHKAHR